MTPNRAITVMTIGLSLVSWWSADAFPAESCSDNNMDALSAMQVRKGSNSVTALYFKNSCEGKDCFRVAYTNSGRAVARLPLNLLGAYKICKETKVIDGSSDNSTDCSRRYRLEYQTIAFEHTIGLPRIIFETVETIGDGRNCSSPDSNDGPALASFASSYSVSNESFLYVYELENYRSVQDAIKAARKYTERNP